MDENQQPEQEVLPVLTLASLDAPRSIVLRFSQRIPIGELQIENIRVFVRDGEQVEPRTLRPLYDDNGWCDTFMLATRKTLRFGLWVYEIEAGRFGSVIVQPRRVLRDKRYFFDADIELGAIYGEQETTFRVFAPSAITAHVVIANVPEGEDGKVEYAMRRFRHGVYEATIPGDFNGQFYAYKLTGVGLDGDREVPDVYATCMQNRHARSLIVDPAQTDPPGFRDQQYDLPDSPVDAVIYETGVRDFTMAASSGVTRRGKFLGMTQAGTHLPDRLDIPTALDHLVELGVTHVQLMPVQDFDNDENTDEYHWGYMPAFFNSPDGWFASQVDGPIRVRELKHLIQMLHERNIGVIMDVVYNHTAGCSSFDQLVPNYYYRMTEDGHYFNGSGCGNEFASELPMGRKFILDSLKYWAKEYRVDGFRFDLMGLIDLQTMKQVREELVAIYPKMLIYGEPWAGGNSGLYQVTEKRHVRGTGIGSFNDRFRDAIKGSTEGDSPGFIQVGLYGVRLVRGLMGSVHDWAVEPTDTINYFEAHDNLTAWDKLILSMPESSDEQRRRMMRMAHLILLSSQGAVFLHSGQEFCRHKQLNRNSYNAPDSINRVDWQLKRQYHDVYDYVRGLIAFRKAHPLLRLRNRGEIEKRVEFRIPPNDRSVVYLLKGGDLDGESAGRMLVLLNGGDCPATFPVPEGRWTVHADADRFDFHPMMTVCGQVELPAHSGMLLSC